jgi:tetratricopeptide (TPR) repeat protein
MPWKDVLERGLGSLGKAGVCQAFGLPAASVAEAFGDLPIVGPGGYDAVAGGGLLEVFPGGKAVRNGPSIELLFVGDRLYEVRLNFRDTAGVDLGAKAIAEATEVEAEEVKDHLGRKLGRVVDGDLVIEYLEEKWYGRTLKTLVFASVQIREFVDSARGTREKAEISIAEGDGFFGKWKFEEALESYRAAAGAMDSLGLAHVKQALMLTRLERFDEVGTAVRKALEVSAEPRVRAEALGLLAVTALYDEDKAAALGHFRKAAATDPANGFFEMSAKELESGEYATDRVARTAARMECLKKKSFKSTFRGLLARGNFPDMKTYFDVLKKAKSDPAFDKLKKDASRGECN